MEGVMDVGGAGLIDGKMDGIEDWTESVGLRELFWVWGLLTLNSGFDVRIVVEGWRIVVGPAQVER
jgi:hypothetical protein